MLGTAPFPPVWSRCRFLVGGHVVTQVSNQRIEGLRGSDTQSGCFVAMARQYSQMLDASTRQDLAPSHKHSTKFYLKDGTRLLLCQGTRISGTPDHCRHPERGRF